MKTLFVHSSRFVRTSDGNVYSQGQFPYRRWTTYLRYFDEVAVICRMADGQEAPSGWDRSSGEGVTFVGTPDDHGKPLMQMCGGPALAVIRKELQGCDAVIVRQSRLGWLAAGEAQRCGIPWAVEVVGDMWDAYWNYGTLLGKLYAPVAWCNSRYWIGKTKFAIYVTQNYLQRKYPCRGLSCGVSDVHVIPVSNAILEQKSARWNTNRTGASATLSLGMIGSLVNRYKGLHVALRALRRLKDQGVLLRLHVLGKGNLDSWRQEAKRLGVTDQLCLDGVLPSGEAVMQWLDALDVYLQPSLTEGLPRALIEAMSRGLPALGSSCGGIPELLPRECLHRPGDEKTLAMQVMRMVQDRAWRIQQSERNFGEAKKYYGDCVEAKRDAFWRQFAEIASAQKGSA